MYNDYGFQKKGIDIFDISKEDFASFRDKKYARIESSFDKKIENSKNFISKLILKYKKNYFLKSSKNLDEQVIKGQNAYYSQYYEPIIKDGETIYKKTKKIFIDMSKNPHYLPHESGHAQNFMNKNLEYAMHKIWKNPYFLKKSLLLILAVSLLTKPQKEQSAVSKENKPKNPLYPIGLFIKNNCGKLAFLTLLPLVAEEGLASLNGQKMCKKYLDKAHLKILARSHIMSFISYLSMATATGLSVYLAAKAKDKIMESKIVS